PRLGQRTHPHTEADGEGHTDPEPGRCRQTHEQRRPHKAADGTGYRLTGGKPGRKGPSTHPAAHKKSRGVGGPCTAYRERGPREPVRSLAQQDEGSPCGEKKGQPHNTGQGARLRDPQAACPRREQPPPLPQPKAEDRKSTRLNSSHVKISYAVFCLKKKKEHER